MISKSACFLSLGLKASLATFARVSPNPETAQPAMEVDFAFDNSNFLTSSLEESESELELESDDEAELSDGMVFAQRERKEI